ncbi:MAG: alcohol acetyltransferase [Leucobacter sp.]
MSGRAWVRLDNASNIFLAARSDTDSKVFRISAEVDHEVDPLLLQAALDSTYDRYPLYRAVLRRGVFWYYLQDSDLRPRVSLEQQPTCAAIYQADRRTLLFRVVYYRRRIVLETFHALSDGTGALWFLSDLVNAYVSLRYPGDYVPPTDPPHELVGDSFGKYFRGRSPEGRKRQAFGSRAYRVRGTRTPDNRTRAVELTMPVADVLRLARAEGVTLTMYLTALFFEAIRRDAGDLGKHRTIAASVPVNLRQFFPSTSARNFFTTVRVEHTYGDPGSDDLGAVCRDLEAQFRPKTAPEALEKHLRQLIRLERMPLLRVVPRPLKDFLLGLINRSSNRGLTVALSNLGNVMLPEPAESRVGRMLFHVSAARPQFCAISHAGLITVTFTSPFSETGHVREFARMLTAHGVDVTVAAARVTEAELAEAAR